MRTDSELTFAMVRQNLMLRNFEAAEEWTELAKTDPQGAQVLVRLGSAYESARQSDKAAAHYRQALAAGYYPEALLGLGRIDAERKKKEQAKQHLLGALDMQRTLGDGGVGPLQVFHQTVSHLLMLQEPVLKCQAWIATLNGSTGPAPLANKSFMIYASDRHHAEQCLTTILGAMQPGLPPPLTAAIAWHPAPREQQPDGPVRPGVQHVLG